MCECILICVRMYYAYECVCLCEFMHNYVMHVNVHEICMQARSAGNSQRLSILQLMNMDLVDF